MTLLSGACWAVNDDDGTGQSGTIGDLAWVDAVEASINALIHSVTNPTVTPEDIIDEIVVARNGQASLNAYLATIGITNYLTGAADLGQDFLFIGGRSLLFADPDVAHGMTGIVATNRWGAIQEISGTVGGALLIGLSDSDQRGLQLYGINGGAAPTTGGITVVGAKKNGSVAGAFAASEVVMGFYNYLTRTAEFLGNGDLVLGDPAAADTKIVWDTGDYLNFNRAASSLTFAVGSAAVFSVSAARVGVVNGTAAAPSFGPAATPDVGLFFNTTVVGVAVVGHEVMRFSSNGSTIAYFEMSEHSDASAPAADAVRIYAKDNGAGKTQLVARFSSGAVQQIAIQP